MLLPALAHALAALAHLAQAHSQQQAYAVVAGAAAKAQGDIHRRPTVYIGCAGGRRCDDTARGRRA